MELERYRIYSEIARGIRKPFLVFKNANVFMAHSGEFCKGDVAVEDGIVIGVGEYEGETDGADIKLFRAEPVRGDARTHRERH